MSSLAPALVLNLVILAGIARADGPEVIPEAQPHVDAGKIAYAAADYDTASREFEAAYEIDPDPTLLYAWAQSLRLGGHCTEAVPLYHRFLDTKPSDKLTAEVDKLILLCEPAKPLPAPEPKPEPRLEPTPPTSDVRTRWYRDRLGGALAIGGVAITATGLAFLVLAKRSEDAAQDAELRNDFIELLDEATLRRRIGYVGLGLGAALVVGGVVRYITRRDEPATIAITPTGAAVVVHGRF